MVGRVSGEGRGLVSRDRVGWGSGGLGQRYQYNAVARHGVLTCCRSPEFPELASICAHDNYRGGLSRRPGMSQNGAREAGATRVRRRTEAKGILFPATKPGVGTFYTMSHEAKQLCPACSRPMPRARTIEASDVQPRMNVYECLTCHVTYTEAVGDRKGEAP